MRKGFRAVLAALTTCAAVLLAACANIGHGETPLTTETPSGTETPLTTETPSGTETETTAATDIRIEYAEGTVAAESPDASREGVDENAQKTMGLQFENDAYSADGLTFDCYIANPSWNDRDMFFAIYADAELSEQLFLSGLAPPGQAFERVTLRRPLPEGDRAVYVAFAQTEETDGRRTMRAQALVTMDFHVKFPGAGEDTGGDAGG